MYKTYCSPCFQGIRIDSLLGDDPVFMAVSVCSVCGAPHIFSHCSKHHPYISFGLGVFLMETCEVREKTNKMQQLDVYF